VGSLSLSFVNSVRNEPNSVTSNILKVLIKLEHKRHTIISDLKVMRIDVKILWFSFRMLSNLSVNFSERSDSLILRIIKREREREREKRKRN